jgi:hypothetical protein
VKCQFGATPKKVSEAFANRRTAEDFGAANAFVTSTNLSVGLAGADVYTVGIRFNNA